MHHRGVKLFLAVFAIGVAFFIVSPSDASAQATLSISPGSGTHGTGGTFTASVVANAPQAYNTVGATISFPPSQLNVVSISKGSFAQLCAVEPTYSNGSGTIELGCGNTTGTTGSATIITITFRATGTGSARVSFSDGQVLAADGKGTNILSNMVPATYTLTAAAPPPPPPPPPPPGSSGSSSGSTLSAPKVTSSTHPEEDNWYNKKAATFEWDLPSGTTSVRLILSRDEQTIPSTVYSPPIAERTIEEIEDGVWYFRIRLGNSAGLGGIATFKIQVDTVAPNDFSVEVLSEEGKAEPELKFEATDELSGIGHYEISVDGGEPTRVELDAINNGIYKMDGLDVGEHEIVVTAVDKAGNKKSAGAINTNVTEELKKAAVAPVEEGPGFFEKWGNAILIFILLAAIGALIALLILEKKKMEELKIAATREVGDVRATMEKVLSALRDEGEDLFAGMDGKAGLNHQEAAAFKELREAVDISEELINREIDDVDKLMK